jgi:hypothetical protein
MVTSATKGVKQKLPNNNCRRLLLWPFVGELLGRHSCTSTSKNLTKTPGILHLHHWIAELLLTRGCQTRVYLWPTELGGSQIGRPGSNPHGIFLVLDPAIDGVAAVNELRLHNTALLSLVLIENLVNMLTAIHDLILVPRCIAQRHLSPGLLTIDKWLIIMQF